MPTRILGIESSCDETAAAMVVDGREILSSVVSSQLDIHRKYGGVVPELASREHLRQIVPVVREALLQAGLEFGDIDAVGVTQGPGLVGSLLVGVTYGKVLATELEQAARSRKPSGRPRSRGFPRGASGRQGAGIAGDLSYRLRRTHAAVPRLPRQGMAMRQSAVLQYRRLGGTRDDAAGEAYDKVARLLALGYPGGPIIDQIAAKVAASGEKFREKDQLNFNPVKIKGNPYDFSFSGIKTAASLLRPGASGIRRGNRNPQESSPGRPTQGVRSAAALQPSYTLDDFQIPSRRRPRSRYPDARSRGGNKFPHCSGLRWRGRQLRIASPL